MLLTPPAEPWMLGFWDPTPFTPVIPALAGLVTGLVVVVVVGGGVWGAGVCLVVVVGLEEGRGGRGCRWWRASYHLEVRQEVRSGGKDCT